MHHRTISRNLRTVLVGIVCISGVAAADGQLPEPAVIAVDSPAFVFSPGNWVGDEGRGGSRFRQTWNTGAYFRVTWETKTTKPHAVLRCDVSGFERLRQDPSVKVNCPPTIAYCIDGMWRVDVPYAAEIPIEDLAYPGKHTLTVTLQRLDQVARWGSDGKSGLNVLRVTGLAVDAGSAPVPGERKDSWAMIVGDSITEVNSLCSYSYLLGQSLQSLGFEYGISACGWSGWLVKGDNPPGDVPAYYAVSGSKDGAGGTYDDGLSRWNKIDGDRHSLLDQAGRISAYGGEGQTPSLIVINYGTNDAFKESNTSDTVASIAQGLAALRQAAPEAQIDVIIPFRQLYVEWVKKGVSAYRTAHPGDVRVAVIDLGQAGVTGCKVMGGVHPSDVGNANLAARLIPHVVKSLAGDPRR